MIYVKEVKEAGVGVQLYNNRTITGMLLADGVLGHGDLREKLQ